MVYEHFNDYQAAIPAARDLLNRYEVEVGSKKINGEPELIRLQNMWDSDTGNFKNMKLILNKHIISIFENQLQMEAPDDDFVLPFFPANGIKVLKERGTQLDIQMKKSVTKEMKVDEPSNKPKRKKTAT